MVNFWIPYYTRHKASIAKEGIKTCLKIHPTGLISRGNTRYYIARELMQEFVPVDLAFFLGMMYVPSLEHITIQSYLLKEFVHHPKDAVPVRPLNRYNVPYDPVWKSKGYSELTVFREPYVII